MPRKKREYVWQRYKIRTGDKLVFHGGKGHVAVRIPRHIAVSRESKKEQ